MIDYFSCTPFADYIRGTPKPQYLGMKEWREWDFEAKNAHPFRYWVAEVAVDAVKDTLLLPIEFLYSIKYWLLNRFVTKTHALTSNTLPMGKWHEFDTRLLHCMFDELVNFVEYEVAWNYIAWGDNLGDMYAAPWNATGWFRTRTWHCPEAGVASLLWQSQLAYDDGTPTQQAKGALEILALYSWWKSDYLNRVDPHEASGWTALCDSVPDDEFLDFNRDRTADDRTDALQRTIEIEQQYANEETEMMCRLIKIRASLWT